MRYLCACDTTLSKTLAQASTFTNTRGQRESEPYYHQGALEPKLTVVTVGFRERNIGNRLRHSGISGTNARRPIAIRLQHANTAIEFFRGDFDQLSTRKMRIECEMGITATRVSGSTKFPRL